MDETETVLTKGLPLIAPPFLYPWEPTMTRNELETAIDAIGLDSLLHDMASICGDKAEHIRVNWQDKSLAYKWEAIAIKLDAVGRHVKGVFGD